MGEDIKTRKYKVSEFEDFIHPIEADKDAFTHVSNLDKDVEETAKIEISLEKIRSSFEESGGILGNILGKRDVLLNEKWDISENIQGKIVLVNEAEVNVDCLVNIEFKTFEHRSFPFYLFKHIDGLTENKTVIIKTRMKPGAVRIDVYPGEGIVNNELFKQKENWDSLVGGGLDEKLTEW